MTEVSEVSRPAPLLNDDNHFYWDAAREGRLVTQKCQRCGRLRHPPRPMCPVCHSLDFEIIDLAGDGVVYSYAILHHPQNPAFEYPVLAALIDLDEGVRVLSNLVDVDPRDISIGMPVTVDFRPTRHDGAVPVFKPKADGRWIAGSGTQPRSSASARRSSRRRPVAARRSLLPRRSWPRSPMRDSPRPTSMGWSATRSIRWRRPSSSGPSASRRSASPAGCRTGAAAPRACSCTRPRRWRRASLTWWSPTGPSRRGRASASAERRSGAEATSSHSGTTAMQWCTPYGVLTPASWMSLNSVRYMHTYGVSSEDFGRAVVQFRDYAANNPNAHFYKKPITLGRAPGLPLDRRTGHSALRLLPGDRWLGGPGDHLRRACSRQ